MNDRDETDLSRGRVGGAPDGPSLDALLDDVQLDALGLLDDDDRAALHEWIASLPEQRRRRIRDEQERLSRGAPMIGASGSLTPPETLRRAVVEAVLAEIARSAERESTRRERNAATRRHAATADRPRRHTSRRVHPVWRAAAMGLSVALVGAMVFHLQTQRYVQDIESSASLAGLFDAFGSSQVEAMLFDGSMRRITFVASDASFEGMGASIWIGDQDTAALLFTSRLPDGPGVSYRLAMVDENGRPAETSIVRFEADGVISRVSLSRATIPADGAMALVRRTPEGETVVMTARLA